MSPVDAAVVRRKLGHIIVCESRPRQELGFIRAARRAGQAARQRVTVFGDRWAGEPPLAVTFQRIAMSRARRRPDSTP